MPCASKQFQNVPTGGGGYYIGEDPLYIGEGGGGGFYHTYDSRFYVHQPRVVREEVVIASLPEPDKLIYPQPDLATRVWLGSLTVLGLFLLYRTMHH